MQKWLANWRRRHQHPVSRALHAIAIPLLPIAGGLALVQLFDGAWSLWWRPVGLLAISFALQWFGHAIEGNDMGELILIKKALGRDYVAVSPRFESRTGSSDTIDDEDRRSPRVASEQQ